MRVLALSGLHSLRSDTIRQSIRCSMPQFRCLIVGENFPGILIGESQPVGFYATRYVEAASVEEAEEVALSLLRDDAALSVPPESRSRAAKIFFEKIDALAADEKPQSNTGFSFFVMGT